MLYLLPLSGLPGRALHAKQPSVDRCCNKATKLRGKMKNLKVSLRQCEAGSTPVECPYWNIDKCITTYSLTRIKQEDVDAAKLEGFNEGAASVTPEDGIKQEDVDAAKLEGFNEGAASVTPEDGIKQEDVDAAKLEGMKEMCETVGGTFDASTCTLPETTAPTIVCGVGTKPNAAGNGCDLDGNGEEVCEGSFGDTQEECESHGCCVWDYGECFSDVGDGPCLPANERPKKAGGEVCYEDDECASGTCGGSYSGYKTCHYL